MLHNIFKQTWGEIEKLGVSGTATPWQQGNTIKKKPIQSLAIAHPNDALCIGTLFSLQQPLKVAMVLVNSHKTPQTPAKDIECFNFWYFGWKNTKKLGVSGTATPWKQGNTIKKSQFGVSIAHPNDALCIKNRTTWILRNFAYRVGALMLHVTDKYTILIFETTSFVAIKMTSRLLCMYSNTFILVRDPRSMVYLELKWRVFRPGRNFNPA
jgi:hypothetical protein